MSKSSFNLQQFPPVYVLRSHFSESEYNKAEGKVLAAGGFLTNDASKARLFIGNISQKRRAALDLRSLEIWTEEVQHSTTKTVQPVVDEEPHPKRRKLGSAGQDTFSKAKSVEGLEDLNKEYSGDPYEVSLEVEAWFNKGASIMVINKGWLEDSERHGWPLPLLKYLIYEGTKVKRSTIAFGTDEKKRSVSQSEAGRNILMRAEAELSSSPSAGPPIKSSETWASTSRNSRGRYNHAGNQPLSHNTKSLLLRRVTSDDEASEGLPEPPDWVKRRSTYSCERATPMVGPNDAFVQELKRIRLARILTCDEIGVRAYSTSIAAVAAYPHEFISPREILALPGCESKIAALWTEFKNNNGVVRAAQDAENDEKLKVIRLFYDIWGVGARTARDFHNKGWRDLDDVVEFGWGQLTRVQQIGVKYYDEFQIKMGREEVEFVAEKIKQHAQRVREPTGVRTYIVGGYRRGKMESGDADIILTHLDETQTLNIINDVVDSLVSEGLVTHELKIYTAGTRRGQATLPYSQIGGGHGFDTLDKALVVWQNPSGPTKDQPDQAIRSETTSTGGSETDTAGSSRDGMGVRTRNNSQDNTPNPHPHRRVDIIVAPWSKIGCAVLGWTADTTFERDLRRYARKVKGWKFDSSGVRNRMTGEEVDLEGVDGKCETIEEAERKVFAGFGLEYREPWERCTG